MQDRASYSINGITLTERLQVIVSALATRDALEIDYTRYNPVYAA